MTSKHGTFDVVTRGIENPKNCRTSFEDVPLLFFPAPERTFTKTTPCTLFESENERQKIEPVPIPLPRASRNFPDVKTKNEKKIYNWTSEIIPFIRFGKQMDRT